MLMPGDKISIVAPASKVEKKMYDDCIEYLKKNHDHNDLKDFEDKFKKGYFFTAASTEERFEQLKKSVEDIDTKIIWTVAGGYGSYELLSLLGNIEKPKTPKLIIGYSDITVLLNYFIEQWNCTALYGPCLKQIVNGDVADESIKQFEEILYSNLEGFKLDKVVKLNNTAKGLDEVEGKVVGGCLSLMQVLQGTDQNIDYKGKILLLEDDRFETPARIHRALDHLKRAGVFKDVKAVLLGSFLEKEDGEEDEELKFVIGNLARYLDDISVPLICHRNIGHVYNMQTIPLGVNIKLSLKSE